MKTRDYIKTLKVESASQDGDHAWTAPVKQSAARHGTSPSYPAKQAFDIMRAAIDHAAGVADRARSDFYRESEGAKL